MHVEEGVKGKCSLLPDKKANTNDHKLQLFKCDLPRAVCDATYMCL